MNKQVIVEIPPKFLPRNIIIDENKIYLEDTLSIDKCISEEIKELWGKGIRTTGCCCGHNKFIGFIQVQDVDLIKMVELGYEWYHDYEEEFGGKLRCDAFIPKSKCKCKKGSM